MAGSVVVVWCAGDRCCDGRVGETVSWGNEEHGDEGRGFIQWRREYM